MADTTINPIERAAAAAGEVQTASGSVRAEKQSVDESWRSHKLNGSTPVLISSTNDSVRARSRRSTCFRRAPAGALDQLASAAKWTTDSERRLIKFTGARTERNRRRIVQTLTMRRRPLKRALSAVNRVVPSTGIDETFPPFAKFRCYAAEIAWF